MPVQRHRREFRRELFRAFYRGFERLDVALVILIVLAFLWNRLADYVASFLAGHVQPWLAEYFPDLPRFEHDPFHPPGWLVTTAAAAFIAWELYKAAQKLYIDAHVEIDRVRTQLPPRLEVSDVRPVEAPFRGRAARNISVSIRNPGAQVAQNCSARLVEVRQRSEFGPLNHHGNPVRLFWPSNGNEIINIGPQTSELLHVFCVVPSNQPARMFIATNHDTSTVDLLKYDGDFSFMVEVVSENTAPLRFTVNCHFSLSTHSASNVTLQQTWPA